MRVLVVDDEPMIAAAMADAIEDAGCDSVSLAGSVQKALQLIERDRYDVAILDANLRGSSAAPVAKALAERATPYLVLSGYSRQHLAESFPGAPILTKPYALERLVEMVRKLGRGGDR
jgi:DNA-binding response OmpR family regulator